MWFLILYRGNFGKESCMKYLSCVLVIVAVLLLSIAAQAGNVDITSYNYTPNLSSSSGTINGKPFRSTTYQYTPNLSSTSGTINGKPFSTTSYQYTPNLTHTSGSISNTNFRGNPSKEFRSVLNTYDY